MPSLRFHRVADTELARGIAVIREEMDLPTGHSAAALAEAEASADRGPLPPPGVDHERLDRRDLHLVAIDPAGARDLDQAFGAQRHGTGYRVHYAIADVAALVQPTGAVDTEALDRGLTFYAPDRRVSLHPEVINEGAGSLLPGMDRSCVLWQIDVDAEGAILDVEVHRATVRVAEALSYRSAQQEIDGPRPRSCLVLLREIGERRLALEEERGAVSLNIPSQEVQTDADGSHRLAYDETLPVEQWNAQISLLTGIAAAAIMIDAGVGLLRTLPPTDPETLSGLRRTAAGLHVPWPETMSYAERVRTLDPNHPNERALLFRSARGLGGAGYVAFLNAADLPSEHGHSAIASPYAHVTAPLRRVCDRFANEVILAVTGGRRPPDWALGTLEQLPSTMGRARQREQAFERAVLDLVEALVLERRVGEEFEALVVNHRRDRAVIQIHEPAIVAELEPKPALGQTVRVRLTGVNIAERRLSFARVE